MSEKDTKTGNTNQSNDLVAKQEEYIVDVEVITSEEFQNKQAERIKKEVFSGEENAAQATRLIYDFVQSYSANKGKVALEVWLANEFRKHSGIWADENEPESTAQEIVQNVQRANEAKESLYAHLDQGKSKESWLATQIETGATVTGTVAVGQYAATIDQAIQTASDGMLGTVTNLDGSYSAARNLDGFIAEQHHVDTFNLDAASKGSAIRAKVLTPEGEVFGKNSMDIGIYDEHGKLVRRYQVKYGQDADASGKLFEKGDYRGQTKVVPEGHAEDIKGARETIEHDGVKSKPLSKEEAKVLQERAQQKREAKQYEWSDVNRINVAKNIGKQALIGAAITAGMQGTRILSRRVWNSLSGKENRSANEDLQEFFESSIKSGRHVGIQVAVSGAVVVAVKNGLLGKTLQGTPAGTIVNAVHIGMENAKILYKFANGELSGPEAIDAVGRVTTSALGGLAAAGYGMVQGAALGTTFGPVGTVIGGFVGGVVGGMAGTKIGEAVYSGGKAIAKTAAKVVKAACESTKKAINSVARALNPVSWFG